MSNLELSTIRTTGRDAFEFLQGQLTNDVRHLEKQDEILAAWCNPKGRVLWFGALRKADAGFDLAVPTDMAEDFVRQLTMFRFRSKVDFEIVDDTATIDPLHLIEIGQPFIGPAQSALFTPHMLNLDLLNAISLEKGCYTGQEIVARTHYRGATKRRMLRFSTDGAASPGDKVSDGQRDVGEVLNVGDGQILAVVPLDKADAGLTVNDAALTRQPLPYL